jgi:pimeloyl-ACP methyl ester carboxylesterase
VETLLPQHMGRTLTAGVPRIAVVVFALTLAGCSRALFFPSKEVPLTPRALGLVYDDVGFASTDGTRLHGWFLHARPVGPESPPTVVFLHGNAGNVANHLGGAAWLPGQGFQVFLFDYRGFGLSDGEPDVESVHRDAIAAIRAAAARDDVDQDRIVVIGQSIGGAIALTAVASVDGDVPVRALVVDSAPSDFRGIAREKLGAFWLTWPLQYPLAWTVPAKPRPLEAAAALSGRRLLFIHGDHDSVVPPHHSFELAAATAGSELLIVPGADHVQAFERPWVQRQVVSFLRNSLPFGPTDVLAFHSSQTQVGQPPSR